MNSPKIVIMEWIAASGKTTIQEQLCNLLQNEGKSVIKVEELEITKNLHNSETRNVEGSIAHLKSIINKYFHQKVEYILLDRFYFSHIPTLWCSMDAFREIQESLDAYDFFIIYTYYRIETVVDRIHKVLSMRNNEGFSQHYDRIISGANSREEEDNKIIQYYENRLQKYEEMWMKIDSRVLKIDVSEISHRDGYDPLLMEIKKFVGQ